MSRVSERRRGPVIKRTTPSKRTKRTRGFTVWFTGLSGSGKTVIADELAKRLVKKGIMVQRLDGDIVRQGLTRDLGFSKKDRDLNIERVTFVAELLTKNGVATVVSFISPYREAREKARARIKDFIEVFLRCPLETCISRDVKGLYKKALAGEIKEFTGVSDPYEEPTDPELVLDTDRETVNDCVKRVLDHLSKAGYI
jgi:adenylyl-sulfate kinase